MSLVARCFGGSDLANDYHDHEWGRPIHDDNMLFEMLTLEAAQAGLSWNTILNKRENYRKTFSGFDPKKVALFDDAKVEVLMQDKGIVRNRLKITSTINNAKVFLAIADEFGTFDNFIWSYVNNTPIVGHWESFANMPAKTELSDRISKDLKKRGFRFVGSTIVYSFLQAAGLVNDHLISCHTYAEMMSVK
ncbi:MAG: DNA-3-methyladenine glycosylase I [Oscillospiraceae bacterium]|nr:DNA-3-methyladenine glycosylase I [Oscillospiraceae bacterium]